jgi:hypothetical protein
MSEGQRKTIGTIVVAASVAVAIGGFIGVKEGFKRRNARKAKLTATAGWGLEPAARDRIFDALERDMKPLLDGPRFKDYRQQQLAAARAKGVKTDDVGFSKELGRTLVARGVPRLPDVDMNALHDLKKKMVFASKRVCPCFWDPTTCTEADVMDGLARLTPPDLVSWSRLSAAAALAELTAPAAVPDTQADFQQGLAAIADGLPRNRRQRFDAILDGVGGAASPSKADQCFAMQTIFTGADAMPPAERIRFARALANAGVER